MQPLKMTTILFNEELHKYTDIAGNVYTSVTQVLGKYEPEFNRKYWLMYVALRDSGYRLRPDDNCKYIHVNGIPYTLDDLYDGRVSLKIDIEDINQQWIKINKEACDRGNQIHKELEDKIRMFSSVEKHDFEDVLKIKEVDVRIRYKEKFDTIEKLKNSDIKDRYPAIYKTLADLIEKGYAIYAEVRVWHNGYLVAGTIDCVAIRGIEFIIVDWKTNKKELHFKAGYYKKERGIETNQWVDKKTYLLYPLNDLEHCKGILYSVQLSEYALILEDWGFVCKGLILYHMRPGKKEQAYTIKYLKDHARKMFQHHYDSLNIKTQGLLTV